MTTPCKRKELSSLPLPKMTKIPDDISECIARNTRLMRYLGWEEFFKERRGRGEFSDLRGV